MLDQVEISSGDRTQQVRLFALSGTGFTPDFVWVTQADPPRLFAGIERGQFKLIEEGWESTGGLLEEHQASAETALLKDLAAQSRHALRRRDRHSQCARLRQRKCDARRCVGRVRAARPHHRGVTRRRADRGNRQRDRRRRSGAAAGSVRYARAHVDRWSGGLNLAAGVTTVRDMGNDNATLQQMIDEIAAGELLSPQIVPAGFLEGESPYSARNGFVVSDLAGAKHAIDWYAEHGYPQMKIYNSFPPAMVRETVAYAHARRHARQRPRAGVHARRRMSSNRASTRSSTSTRCC